MRDYQFIHMITYWKRTDDVDLYNRPVYVVGKLKCRFNDQSRLYVNESGQHVRSSATVYTKANFLSKGDVVIKGDHTYSLTPVAGAFEIKQERHIQNQRGDREEHRYIL